MQIYWMRTDIKQRLMWCLLGTGMFLFSLFFFAEQSNRNPKQWLSSYRTFSINSHISVCQRCESVSNVPEWNRSKEKQQPFLNNTRNQQPGDFPPNDSTKSYLLSRLKPLVVNIEQIAKLPIKQCQRVSDILANFIAMPLLLRNMKFGTIHRQFIKY